LPWRLRRLESTVGELYNLAADLKESKDRAAAELDKVKEPSDLLKQIREKARSRLSKPYRL
jgi:hypothetical protein